MIPKHKQRGEQRRIRCISLPGHLDERMKDFPEVNWSAVAQEAFETALETISIQAQAILAGKPVNDFTEFLNKEAEKYAVPDISEMDSVHPNYTKK